MDKRAAAVMSVIAAALTVPFSVSAQVAVSEVMYDLETGSDSGREWVEVFNGYGGGVKLTEYVFSEGGSNHDIKASQGGDELPSGGYAILADNPGKFLIDWPGYSGLVFDTAFTSGLSNTGEALSIGRVLNGTYEPSDGVSYDKAAGGDGDGNTLQRDSVDGTLFSAGAPTPGAGSLIGNGSPAPVPPAPKNEQSTTTAPAASSGIVSSYVGPPEPKVFAYAGKDRDVIAGADVVFKGVGYDVKGEPLSDSVARFHWNFGDGASAEGASVLHHFSHPGRYAVVLDVADGINDGSAQVVVNAHPVSIAVSLQDGAIVLSNRSGRSLDLSRWHLKSGGAFFTLPEHTVLLAGASVPFTKEITGLLAGQDAALAYPNGTIAAQLGSAPPPPRAPTAAHEDAIEEIAVPSAVPVAIEEQTATSAATAAAAAAVPKEASALWWWGAAFILAFGGAALTFLMRQKGSGEWKIIEEAGDTE